MDADFRWFEGEKAQFRFVPYDWAFLFMKDCLELPRHILREHTDKKTGPDVEGSMAGKEETGGTDETGQHKGDRYIQTRSKLIMEAEKAKEHQGAAHRDRMHADLEIDITHPGAADRQEGSQ